MSILFRTNMLVLYDDEVPLVRVWDDLRKRSICEIELDSPALNALVRLEKLVVVQSDRLHVFSFPSPVRKLATFSSRENRPGLAAVNSSPERQLLVFPGHILGSIELVDMSKLTDAEPRSVSPVLIRAHSHALACLALDSSGQRIASASTHGTRVLVFDALSCRRLFEFRRGADAAVFYCLTFSADAAFLCSASDTGTVHVFALREPALNRANIVSGMKYTSFVNLTVPPEVPCLCSFGAKNSLYAICLDGSYYKFVYSSDGRYSLESYDRFVEIGENSRW